MSAVLVSSARREAIEALLWPPQKPGARPPSSVWAVLDLARDPRIGQLLLTTKLESLSLYAGAPRELERVAPHIVEMLPGHGLLRQLIDEGWGRSWGVFVRIEDASLLRHHLRKFLKVRDARGRSLLFRYYDPRVLRSYLPTCTPDELTQLFGPISHWLAEDAGGDSLIEFGRDRTGVLTRRALPLAN